MPSPRILLLSAGPEDQRTLQEILKPLNAVIEAAFTPLDFNRILLGREFDVAIIDEAMPAFNPRLMSIAQTIQPWLQWLTGWDSAPARAEMPSFLHLNAAQHLSKPWQFDEAQNRILSALKAKQLLMEPLSRLPLSQVLFLPEKISGILQAIMTAENMPHLMDYVLDSFSRIVSCDAAAMLDLDANPVKLNIKSGRTVNQAYRKQIEDEILTTYTALTGKTLSGYATVVENGANTPSTNRSKSLASMFVMPLVSGEQLRGILAFADARETGLSAAAMAYCCHFANYVIKVFPTLRRIQSQAVRDELTGLYNRIHFKEELRRTWQLSRRYNIPVGLLMLDLDGFKSLNDNYGHLVGDAVLREFARLLESLARRPDILVRYGGDEFAVLLSSSDAKQTRAFADRVLSAVTGHVFCPDRYPLHIGVSIGVVGNSCPGLADENDLLLRADRALYMAKERGKGAIVTGEEAKNGEIKFVAPESESAPVEPKGESSGPAGMGRLMVIDDEVIIGTLFEKFLTPKGFTVFVESSPRRALERIKEMPGQIDVALIDFKMPEMNGIEVLEALRILAPDIVPIVVTGYASVDNAIAALRSGAYDFVQKPVNFDELTFTIKRAVEHRRLVQQVEGCRCQLEESLDERTRSLREALDALEKSYMATMEALVAALKVHESDTVPHDVRMAEYAVFLGRRMKLGEDQFLKIRRGALLHDIGKIGIPDAILQKAGPLTDAEKDIIRQHAVIGYNILKNVPFLHEEAEMIYQHHEWFDGTGYPRRLAGQAISLGARLFAVVDAFDALRSDRVYRKAVSLEETAAEIQRGAGTQFDPDIVKVFLSCYPEMEQLGNISTGRNAKVNDLL